MESAPYGPYRLCKWRVESAVPLPELIPWSNSPGPSSAPRDSAVSIDLVPSESAAETESPRFEADPDGACQLIVREQAVFRVSAAADRVELRLAPAADPLLVRAHLYGSILAILCYKHGLLPIHGSCVRMGGSALIFSGPSGAGKSTLATALARRGHTLLCDDVSALDFTNPAHPLLWPAFPRVKLLADAIAAFELDPATTYTRAARGEKGHFGIAAFGAAEPVTTPLPLAAAYALDLPQGDRISATSMSRRDAFLFIESQAHRVWMGRGLGLTAQIFHQLCALAAAIPVYRLERPNSLDRLDQVAALLEEAHSPAARPAEAPHFV